MTISLRLASVVAAIALLVAGLAGAFAQSTAGNAVGAPSKKSPARKRTAKRRPPAPAATAKQKKEAVERVSEYVAQAAQLPIENPATLIPFFEQLYRRQSGELAGPVRILHYGDSHTAADEWTDAVRTALQGKFGDGGSGYSLAGRPWKGYRRFDLRGGASRGWRTEGTAGRLGDGLHGMGGVSIWTTRARESVFLQAECELLELHYLQQPGGGRFQLSDNGELVDTISTDGPLLPGVFHYVAEAGKHRFELATLDRAPVRLFGWVAEKEAGVTYEALGINGAQASIVLTWDESALATQIARRDPALIVLAFGTNDASDRNWNFDNYRRMFTTLLRRMRQAAPAASLLVLGPPDRYYRSRGRWLPFHNLDRIVDAEREAALGERSAFWDTRAQMGGSGAMRSWVIAGLAQRDHVHFTAGGYRRLGELLFRGLMTPYDAYLEARAKIMEAPGHGASR